MPDPSSAPVPGDHDNEPTPPWPLAEGAKSPASPDEATPAIHNEPTPPADGLDEPTPAPDRPDEQAPPPADGVEAPTASASQPPPPAEVVDEPTASASQPPPPAEVVEVPAAPPPPAEAAPPPAPIASDAAVETLEDEPLDEDDVEDGRDEPPRRGGLLTKEVKIDAKTLLALVGVVVLVAVAFGAYQLGQRKDDSAAGPKPTTTTAFRAPKDFVPLNDPATGVTISIPANWVVYSTRDVPDKAIRLTAGIRDTNDSVTLRVNAYSSEITEANIADQKNVFDQLLGGEDIEVFVNQTIKLGGLPALFYVYRFTDKATGKPGIHAHFFVFQGRKMVSVILQALPEERYALLASTFDAIANSLKVAPGPPPAFLEELAGATSTTVGPTAATSVPPSSAPSPASTTP